MSNITPEELEDMLDRAAKRGATAALREVGLHDDDARKDIIEMRNLPETWRDTRRGVWSTIVKMSTVAVITFIAASLWMQIGNKIWLKNLWDSSLRQWQRKSYQRWAMTDHWIVSPYRPFLAASPAAAAKMGKYTMAARRMVEQPISAGMQSGGIAQRLAAYDHYLQIKELQQRIKQPLEVVP